MFGDGVAYAIASLSCTIGPSLAVTTSSFSTGSIIGVVAGFLVATATALTHAGPPRGLSPNRPDPSG